MKIDRYGKAKILTQEEIVLLFRDGLNTQRDRTLFGICLFTAARIREACSLLTSDVFAMGRKVRPEINIRKYNTKGKLATRTIPVSNELQTMLELYKFEIGCKYLFPGGCHRHLQDKHIAPESAWRILKKAFQRVGIEGASTHSFRRTALTAMHNSQIPLRVIQEISGHRDLNQLQTYLEVTNDQVRGAVSSLSVFAPVEDAPIENAPVEERKLVL